MNPLKGQKEWIGIREAVPPQWKSTWLESGHPEWNQVALEGKANKQSLFSLSEVTFLEVELKLSIN